MFRFPAVLVAAFTGFAAVSANAATITVGGGLGNPNGGVNCGSGSHSNFLSSGVAEFNFDGVNGAANGQPCPGTGPDAYFTNYGAINGSYALSGLGTITFNNPSGVGGDVVRGRSEGISGDPWADNTPYLVVPGVNGGSGNDVTLSLTGLTQGANYFGLYWGSLDTYNHISFTLANGATFSYDGAQIAAIVAALPNGDQFSHLSNIYVDFFANGSTISSIRFSSDSRAFEVDNFAIGRTGGVPTPGAFALLGFGLMVMGGLRRRKTA